MAFSRPILCAATIGFGLSALVRPAPAQTSAPPPAQAPRALAASPEVAARAIAPANLDSLVALGLRVHPAIAAAAARAAAARARVGPAGARADPMLMAGIQNFPVSDPGFADFMTMKMIGVSQTLPFPGKLGLRTRAARDEVQAADARLASARLDVIREIKHAYFDLAFIARALDVVERTQAVLGGLISTTQARYTAGTGSQADVLRVRTEAVRLSDEAARLTEARHAALARLNAALARRPSDTPVERPVFPDALVHAAIADSAAQIHFTSAALGARVADSPLPSLDSLQALAIQRSPMLSAHEAAISAQAARVELARKMHLPDVDISLQYGQRQGLSDMVSAVVSIPIPLQKGRKQDEETAAAQAELTALEAEHRAAVNALRADIAARVSEIERARTQLALSVKAVIPQARATLASATAGYQVGRVGFTSVIDAQASLFTIETAYDQALTDFAKAVADLEHTVGVGVLR